LAHVFGLSGFGEFRWLYPDIYRAAATKILRGEQILQLRVVLDRLSKLLRAVVEPLLDDDQHPLEQPEPHFRVAF
jgi:hypothetical protein